MITNQKEVCVYVQNLKNNVKELVRSSHKKASQIAEKIGMNQSNFSKCIHDNQRCFSIDQVCKLAKLFNCSIDELVGMNNSVKSDTDIIIIKNIRELMNNTVCSKHYEFKYDDHKAPLFATLSYNSFDNKDLGDIVGMSESEVSKCFKVEKGSKFFSLDQIKKIADYFGVSVDYLMGRRIRSNFEICEFLSILLDDGKIDIDVRTVKEKRLKTYKSNNKYSKAINDKKNAEHGFIYGRIGEEPDWVEDEVKYPFIRFPEYTTYDDFPEYTTYYDEDDGEYCEETLNFEQDYVNNDSIIINKCLEKLIDAHQKLKDGVYDKEDFDAIVNQALIKVFKLYKTHCVKTSINADTHSYEKTSINADTHSYVKKDC